jgi:branched-chain amino acid aminotransferase
MTTLVMIDGEIVPSERATISVLDRGFLYGDSVFETIRTYGGRPFALGEHIARLEKSAERVFIQLPVPASTIEAEVERAVAAANNPESYMRVMVTRGSGPLGLDFDRVENPVRVVIVGPLVPPPPQAYADGIGVVSYRTRRAAEDTEAVGAKVGNYLVAVLAVREARQAGAAEALVVDGDGNVVEGASSNVFAVFGSTLVTPPEEAGILAGITRAHLLEVARELGLDVRLEPLPLERLGRADEVFISSSIRELLPVVRIDGTAVADGRPGPMTRRLHAAFLEKVRKIMGLVE